MAPFFSIILPTHRRPRLLRRALASLGASACRDFEVIVVADADDPETAEVTAELLSPRDTFLRRGGPAGPAASRNLGLDLARGRRILFLDDDDALLPGFLGAALALAQAHPRAAVYTDFQVVLEDRGAADGPPVPVPGGPAERRVGGLPLDSLYVKNFIINHSVIHPAQTLRQRRQDPRLGSLEDWEFLLNLRSEVAFVHQPVLGPVVYADASAAPRSRGRSPEACGPRVVEDYLRIYSRWPAPTVELKRARQRLLQAAAGLDVPLERL